jgi:hypothetical protein
MNDKYTISQVDTRHTTLRQPCHHTLAPRTPAGESLPLPHPTPHPQVAATHAHTHAASACKVDRATCSHRRLDRLEGWGRSTDAWTHAHGRLWVGVWWGVGVCVRVGSGGGGGGQRMNEPVDRTNLIINYLPNELADHDLRVRPWASAWGGGGPHVC